MTYIILQSFGKQFIIKRNFWYNFDFIKLQKTKSVLFNKLLLLKKDNNIQVGKPFLKNIFILGSILENTYGKKIIVLKTKPKKSYTKIKGHRQKYTKIYFN